MGDFDLFRDYDAFLEESRQFEEDVHLLVLGTFDAAQAYWSGRLDVELPKLEALIKSAKDGEYAQVARLRSEALGRFSIKDSEWDQRMAFIEPFVLARNLIVHNEGEANTLLLDGTKDQEFRAGNPDWVDNSGRVAVPETAVKDHVQQAVEVLQWVAAELRQRELQAQQTSA